MTQINNAILKNGLFYLIQDNENGFKKSLIDVLSIKLNESLESVEFFTKTNLLKNQEKTTKETPEIKMFLEFMQNYNPSTTLKIKFKNESIINITEENIKDIKSLFDQLSPKNRQILAETIFNDPDTFAEHLDFYEKTKALNK
jgi:hypothetical protein